MDLLSSTRSQNYIKQSKELMLNWTLLDQDVEMEDDDLLDFFERQLDYYNKSWSLVNVGELDDLQDFAKQHLFADTLRAIQYMNKISGYDFINITAISNGTITDALRSLVSVDIVNMSKDNQVLAPFVDILLCYRKKCVLTDAEADCMNTIFEKMDLDELVQNLTVIETDKENDRKTVKRVKKTRTTSEVASSGSLVELAKTTSSISTRDDDEKMFRESTIDSIATQSSIASDSINDNRKVTWMHRPRKFNENAKKCFICDGNDEKDLVQCAKKMAGTKCSTYFHSHCIQDYNAGDFNVEYMESLVGAVVCPLHHCDLCWLERKKSTAVAVRNVIQCRGCYRAFHEECRPAGADVVPESVDFISDQGKIVKLTIKTTICHVHGREVVAKIVPLTKRLPICCECETTDKKNLLRCSQCVRSYHAECRSIVTIKGNIYSDNKPLCEGCIHGESIRPGQAIIAKYVNSFYPGVAVALNDYPAHCASVDKYGKYLGTAGFVAVKWGGCQNLFSLLPSIHLVPMFNGSYGVVGKFIKDKDINNSWNELDANLVVPRPKINLVSDKYTKIKTSVYHAKCQKPRLNAVEEETMICDCTDGCATDKCTNRSLHQECPEMCERNGNKCKNRMLTRKEVNPKMEHREAEGKGFGCFATALISSGEFIAEYAGEIISPDEKRRRINMSNKSRNDEEKHYMMTLDSARVIDCKYKGNVARFLNHSCDPNCRVDSVDVVVDQMKGKVRYDRRVRITAMKDIKVGEELCFNYDMEEFSAGCPLPECLCNAPTCTGKLGKTESERKELRLMRTKAGRSREKSIKASSSDNAPDASQDVTVVNTAKGNGKAKTTKAPRSKATTTVARSKRTVVKVEPNLMEASSSFELVTPKVESPEKKPPVKRGCLNKDPQQPPVKKAKVETKKVVPDPDSKKTEDLLFTTNDLATEPRVEEDKEESPFLDDINESNYVDRLNNSHVASPEKAAIVLSNEPEQDLSLNIFTTAPPVKRSNRGRAQPKFTP